MPSCMRYRRRESAMPTKPPVIRFLLGYAKPHRGIFLLVTLFTLLAIAADLMQPYLVKIAIDDNIMVGKNDYGMLVTICGIYLALSVFSFLFNYLLNNLLQKAAQSIIARIRKDRYVLPSEADLFTGIIQFHANGSAHV
ncbi:MAG: hypothetical protein J7559_11475, partial [Cohnella sp.]|nr:hypothetical protein [Cohnella sp.]